MSGIKITNGSNPAKVVFLKNLSYGTVFIHNGNPHMKIYVSGKEGMAVNLVNGIAITLNFGNFAVGPVVEISGTMKEVGYDQYLIKREFDHNCPPEVPEYQGSLVPETAEEDDWEEVSEHQIRKRKKKRPHPDLRGYQPEVTEDIEPVPPPKEK